MRYVLADKIIELSAGRSITAIKHVTMSDALVGVYEPNASTELPAAMMLEAMAQTAGLLALTTIDFAAQPVLAKVQPCEVLRQARAGETLELCAEIEERNESGCHARATAKVENELIAAATIYLGFVKTDEPTDVFRVRVRERLASLFPKNFSVDKMIA
ncbi:MAG: 3-hydroxyacyl-ACP dehydratase FabZ [Pyrinomonadaceae bacterium]